MSGGTVTAAWRGEVSADLPPSRDRMDSLAEEVHRLGVAFHDSPEDVAEACDALLVTACDARTHPALFKRLAPFGKPVYVDTRFALTTGEAHAMLRTAREHGCLPLAGSPKRFTPEFLGALDGDGPVTRIDVGGPLPTQPGHPGLAWYGVHLVDLVVAALGPGCATVGVREDLSTTLHWSDGRIATLSGPAEWSPFTTGRVQRGAVSTEFGIEAGPPMLTGLLTALVDSCRRGVPTVPEAQVLETVAIVEAAHRSLLSGKPERPLR
ncbi:hypothetical protein [Streptomyces sp. NA04227]|uniref:hypothetical protein n=1 Tax=Streptomyces sp. NA04227 TaxID=2742136 RepID=UPI001C377377|nr:hypothetical protein [Streptomyces sp. NA04227]